MTTPELARRAELRRLWHDAEQQRSQHVRKHRAILTSAARLFAERGFHETTIDDIASELQVTKPTIYYYVRSKDDILFQIAHVEIEEINSALAAHDDRSLPADRRLERFIQVYGEFLRKPNGSFGRIARRSGHRMGLADRGERSALRSR